MRRCAVRTETKAIHLAAVFHLRKRWAPRQTLPPISVSGRLVPVCADADLRLAPRPGRRLDASPSIGLSGAAASKSHGTRRGRLEIDVRERPDYPLGARSEGEGFHGEN